MTYNPNIPQGTDRPSASQSQLLTNFQQINTVFNANHYQFTDGSAALRGMHRSVVLEQQGAGVATSATQGALYTKALGGSPNLYWRRKSNGAEILMTANHTPSSAANGFTFLPGNLLLQWGSLNAPSGESAAINFPTAFSAIPYSINVTAQRTATSNATPMFVSSTTVPTATQFRIVNTSSNAHTGYWMAIGPA